MIWQFYDPKTFKVFRVESFDTVQVDYLCCIFSFFFSFFFFFVAFTWRDSSFTESPFSFFPFFLYFFCLHRPRTNCWHQAADKKSRWRESVKFKEWSITTLTNFEVKLKRIVVERSGVFFSPFLNSSSLRVDWISGDELSIIASIGKIPMGKANRRKDVWMKWECHFYSTYTTLLLCELNN